MDDFKDVVKWLLTTKVFWAGVITFALLYAMFQHGRDDAVPTSIAAATKKTPIYSVESKDKVVALSFDAAWGNAIYGLFYKSEKDTAFAVSFLMNL